MGLYFEKGLVWGEAEHGGGGEGGVSDHTQLSNLGVANQHPLRAVIGLENALTTVETTADSAQATAESKVSKSGDTMTGPLAAPKFDGLLERAAQQTGNPRNCYVNSAVKVWQHSAANATGAIAIRLPATDTMFTMSMSLYQRLTNPAYTFIGVGGQVRNSGGSPLWQTPLAYCGNAASVGRIRFGYKDGYCLIVLGDETSAWVYPLLAVHSMAQGWAEGDLANNLEITLEPDLSDITFTATNLIPGSSLWNKGLMPDRVYVPVARGTLTGATGAFVLQYGDIALTKMGTGVYNLTSSTLTGFSAQLILDSAVPLIATWNSTDSTLRIRDEDKNPTDANGKILIWT